MRFAGLAALIFESLGPRAPAVRQFSLQIHTHRGPNQCRVSPRRSPAQPGPTQTGHIRDRGV